MSANFFDTPIEYLKGVGPERADILKKELQIFTFADLLQHYPFRYVDRSKFYKVREVNADLPYIQLKGTITQFETVGAKQGQRLIGYFQDETGEMELVWFKGIKWITKSLKTNTEYIVFGKPTVFGKKINIVHPEIETPETQTNTNNIASLQAVYNSTDKLKAKGLESRGIAKLQRTLLSLAPPFFPETLSEELLTALKLISRKEAVTNIHLPQNPNLLQKAQFRLKFEELFFIQLRLLKYKVIRSEKTKGLLFLKIDEHFNRFYKEKLPFELTAAQKKVIREIRQDVGSGKQMNRLLQGDVGSGKTLVALMSMLMALDNGYQASMMAPTEILANQHFETLTKMLDGLGINIQLLTGSTKTKQRKIISEQLLNGEIHILLGTHALLEDNVQFKNLGLVVIDEQHRFGVEQRAKMWEKSPSPAPPKGRGEPTSQPFPKYQNSLPLGEGQGGAFPHILIMTATPIPRTLAMTLYGDLDVSVIDELPPGRTPIKTMHRFDSSRLRVFGFIKEQIKQGRQVYVVYPLIQESEKMDYKNLMDGYDSITREFQRPEYHVSVVHGQMKTEDKDFEMQRFIKGETDIMVATTVIEVGVDVPNATVMIIESAERFGLSQLHQLRGRVGRGAAQSFCILMTAHKLSNDAKTRMETMVRTTDGFEIADTDLKLRGPGDIAGLQQSGVLNLHIADLSRDAQILQLARQAAIKILEEDPHLSLNKNIRLNNYLTSSKNSSMDWNRIG